MRICKYCKEPLKPYDQSSYCSTCCYKTKLLKEFIKARNEFKKLVYGADIPYPCDKCMSEYKDYCSAWQRCGEWLDWFGTKWRDITERLKRDDGDT